MRRRRDYEKEMNKWREKRRDEGRREGRKGRGKMNKAVQNDLKMNGDAKCFLSLPFLHFDCGLRCYSHYTK